MNYWSDEQQGAYNNLRKMGEDAFNPVNSDQVFSGMFDQLLYGTLKSILLYALVFGCMIAAVEGVKYLWRKKFSSTDVSKLS